MVTNLVTNKCNRSKFRLQSYKQKYTFVTEFVTAKNPYNTRFSIYRLQSYEKIYNRVKIYMLWVHIRHIRIYGGIYSKFFVTVFLIEFWRYFSR